MIYWVYSRGEVKKGDIAVRKTDKDCLETAPRGAYYCN